MNGQDECQECTLCGGCCGRETVEGRANVSSRLSSAQGYDSAQTVAGQQLKEHTVEESNVDVKCVMTGVWEDCFCWSRCTEEMTVLRRSPLYISGRTLLTRVSHRRSFVWFTETVDSAQQVAAVHFRVHIVDESVASEEFYLGHGKGVDRAQRVTTVQLKGHFITESRGEFGLYIHGSSDGFCICLSSSYKLFGSRQYEHPQSPTTIPMCITS
jgi:hypothetical protein